MDTFPPHLLDRNAKSETSGTKRDKLTASLSEADLLNHNIEEHERSGKFNSEDLQSLLGKIRLPKMERRLSSWKCGSLPRGQFLQTCGQDEHVREEEASACLGCFSYGNLLVYSERNG